MNDTQVGTRMADTRDMIAVHGAMLRELRLAPELVRGAADAGRRRVTQVAGHVQLVLDLLHHHHTGEDERLWPLLAARLGPGEVETSAMEAQHARIAPLVARGVRLLEGWRSAPGDQAESLAATLHDLHAAVREHLLDEEATVLPLVERHLTEREWQQFGEAAMASIAKPRLPLVVGMIGYGSDPAVVTLMLASAPRPVRAVLPWTGAAVYARYARRIHSTSTP